MNNLCCELNKVYHCNDCDHNWCREHVKTLQYFQHTGDNMWESITEPDCPYCYARRKEL